MDMDVDIDIEIDIEIGIFANFHILRSEFFISVESIEDFVLDVTLVGVQQRVRARERQHGPLHAAARAGRRLPAAHGGHDGGGQPL